MIRRMPIRQPEIAIVLPVYNHSATVGMVLQEIIEHFPHALVLVVNDGSTDGTSTAIECVRERKPESQITVLEHRRNRGKGAALMTGFRAAWEAGCTHAMTMDADGQHQLSDAIRLAAIAHLFPDDLITGDRQIDRRAVPVNSRRGRDMSRFWLWLQTGIDIPDPQCGLRVYPLSPTLAVRCLTRRYDFETEIATRLAWSGVRIRSAAVACIYFSPEQRVTHFRPLQDTVRGILINIILITQRILYLPPGHMAPIPASMKTSLYAGLRDRRYWRDLLNLSGCKAMNPSLSAAAAGIGVLIAFLPVYGFQSILAIYIARRLHLNIVLMVLATQVSFPPVSIGIILISIGVGHLLLYRTLPPISLHLLDEHSVWYWLRTFTADLVVGSLICGLMAGAIALLATRLAFGLYYQRRRNAPDETAGGSAGRMVRGG